MPVCVECGSPVTTLYTEYSPGNIRITQCSGCKNFVDKYIEHDVVIIFIDMILLKSQVYRHILFNRLPYQECGIEPRILKIQILLILFEVYIKWSRLETYHGKGVFPPSQMSFLEIYFYLLSLCVLETLGFFIGVQILIHYFYASQYIIFKYNYVITTLILSSFGKLLFVLMVIWEYNEMEYFWAVNALVISSNIEALSVFLQTSVLKVAPIILFGSLTKYIVQYMVSKLDPLMVMWSS